MKTYTVKDIAQILGKDEGTVRRWIRDGKLKGSFTSRKKGNVITDADFQRFLAQTPRYAKSIAKLAAPALAFFSKSASEALVIGGTAIATILAEYFAYSNKTNELVKAEDFKRFINNSISERKEIIDKKKDLIKQTEQEIDDLQSQIDQLLTVLNNEDVLKSLTNFKAIEGSSLDS